MNNPTVPGILIIPIPRSPGVELEVSSPWFLNCSIRFNSLRSGPLIVMNFLTPNHMTNINSRAITLVDFLLCWRYLFISRVKSEVQSPVLSLFWSTELISFNFH